MLRAFVEKSRQQRIRVAVVGDMMLDRWHQVRVNRISPEAPVPVWLSDGSEPVERPGGAANVACQFRNFNAEVSAHGIMNPAVRDHLTRRNGVNTDAATMVGGDGLMPTKIRYMADDVQVGRLDIERPKYGLSDHDLYLAQLHVFTEMPNVPQPDVLVMSDYAKGMFQDKATNYQAWAVPTIVDPKTGPIDRWVGCTVFKPNDKEAYALSGLKDPRKQAEYFVERLKCRGVVITHGANGVTGIDGDRHFSYALPWETTDENARMISIPRQVAVHSAVGAGDCFQAFLAMAIARGFSIEDAAKIAFEAGAIYVTHRHNDPVTVSELLDADLAVENKIRRAEDIPHCHVFTNGCFDILHPGHLALLRYCKSFCQNENEKLVVAINSDESVRRLKGPSRPIHSQKERAELLASLGFVDYVVVFEDDSPYQLIGQLEPNILVKGGDYTEEQVVGRELVKQVKIFPTLPGHSTTEIVNRGRDGSKK
jgi:D-beta-D-heptose 7-phosphate kinase/D-beta-D-heptose 1-phosphate adenosyltransferase